MLLLLWWFGTVLIGLVFMDERALSSPRARQWVYLAWSVMTLALFLIYTWAYMSRA